MYWKNLYPASFWGCSLRNLPAFCLCDPAAWLFLAIFSSLPLCLQTPCVLGLFPLSFPLGSLDSCLAWLSSAAVGKVQVLFFSKMCPEMMQGGFFLFCFFLLFCCFATNTGRNVSRSLRSSSSWLHLLWNPKCVPAAEGAATYSYFSFSPPEKEPCQHQGRLGSAGENPGEMHPGSVSLRWFPMRDVSQAGRQPVPGTSRELLSRVGGSWNWAEGGLALIFPGSPTFCCYFSYLVHLYSPVAPAHINEVFLSAEPAAVAQLESGWSESGLKLQGGLLARWKIVQIV